jgi:hypothetical protein
LRSSNSPVSHILKAMDRTDRGAATQKLNDAINKYTASMGYLTATMGASILQNNKAEKRQKLLKWLASGKYWERHKEFRERRISGTGKWFLDSIKYWMNSEKSHSLICHGIRITLLSLR